MKPVRRMMAWGGLVCLIAAAMLPVALYWQEGPFRLARQEASEGKFQEAFSRVSYFLEGHPSHSDAVALKARLLVALGRPQEALELFDQVGPATTEDVHAWARAYMRVGRMSRALPLLSHVTEQDRLNADALYELCAVRIQLGLLEEAVSSAERLAALPGHEARGHVFLAAIYHDLDDQEKSAATYARILELSPAATELQIPADELLLQYGQVLIALGRTEEAVEFLRRSIAHRPTPAALLTLGNAFSQLGQDAEAERAWKASVDLEPQARVPREALADAALQKGNPELALTWLKPLESSKELKASTAYLFQRVAIFRKDKTAQEEWGKVTARLRDEEKLESAVEHLLLSSPHSWWANVLRAYRFAKSGNWEQAEDMIRGLSTPLPDDEFIRSLVDAIRRRGELPALAGLNVLKQSFPKEHATDRKD